MRSITYRTQCDAGRQEWEVPGGSRWDGGEKRAGNIENKTRQVVGEVTDMRKEGVQVW